MRIRSAVLAALAAGLPTLAGAQSPGTDTLFARSPWAAEGSIANGVGASLMRVHPSGTAWLVSLAANGASSRAEISAPLSVSQKFSAANVALAFGLRHYRGHDSLRPYLEGGLFGQWGYGAQEHQLGGGIYGEVGAAYFFNPHVSLGVAQDLNLGYQRAWGGDPQTRVRSWTATLPNPRLRLAVFF